MEESFERTLSIIPQGVMMYTLPEDYNVPEAKCQFLNKQMSTILAKTKGGGKGAESSQ